ncbi:N amino acid transport system protein [Galdieria sulphuraria]|nr:N amino acid transport system protein [Galdieria sulphuraria]
MKLPWKKVSTEKTAELHVEDANMKPIQPMEVATEEPVEEGETEFEKSFEEAMKESFDLSRRSRSSSFDPNDPDKEYVPPRKMSWWMLTLLMCGYMVGIGVLSIPSAFQTLGWIGGVFVLTGAYFITTATGYFLYYMGLRYPTVRSYASMSRRLWGKPGMYFTATIAYSYFFALLTSDLLTSSLTWKNMLQKEHICTVVFAVIAYAMMLLAGQARSLFEITYIILIAITFIVIPIIIVCVKVPSIGAGLGKTYAGSSTSFYEGLTAAMDIIFAFTGHLIYFEFMAELKRVEDFPTALWLSQTFSYACYLTLAAVAYYYIGNTGHMESPVTLVIKHGTIGGNVLSRAVQWGFQPLIAGGLRKFRDGSLRNRLWWLLWTGITYGAAFIVAELVPFFSSFIGIMTSLFSSFLTFMVPSAFYFWEFWHDTRWYQKLLPFFCFLVGFLMLTLGSYGTFKSLVVAIESTGKPFSCNRKF